jgi:protein TonB
MIALFSGIGLMVSLICIPVVVNYFKGADILPHVTPVALPDPTIIDEPLLIEPPKPNPVEPAAGGAPSSEPTVAFTQPVAVTSPAPVDLPTTQQVQATNPGTQTAPGVEGGVINGTNNNPNPGTGTGPGTGPNTEGTIETFVDVAPVYPGGLDQFRKDVGQRFRTPEVNDATIMKVYVSFVVETDGTLTNIKATRDPGFGMGAEAVRVLKSLKARWTPGMKNGKAVRTAYNLPITVKVN